MSRPLFLASRQKLFPTVTATSPMRVLVMTRQSFREMDRTMPALHATIVEAIQARREAAQMSSS